jgi:TM2 domain-containing membrane protein YozV
MEKVWVVKDPGQYRSFQETWPVTDESPPDVEKNPAVAYTLSLFCWGAGQLYNGQKKKGLWFLFAMLLSCTGAALSFVYWSPLFQALRSYDISCLSMFITAEVLFFSALVFWNYNAGNAYHTSVQARTTPFTEVPSRAYPFLCSLLIPGWGQHLNGQPVKGALFNFFSLFSLFSIVSIPATLLAWPSLEASGARRTVEEIFTLMVLFVPLIPVVWIFGSFDAFKVSIDDLKKEPLFDRIKYANNRRRMHGLVRGVFPHIRSTVFLLLLLVFLFLISSYVVPKHFYIEQLADAQTWLRSRGMTIVPELIGRLLSNIG